MRPTDRRSRDFLASLMKAMGVSSNAAGPFVACSAAGTDSLTGDAEGGGPAPSDPSGCPVGRPFTVRGVARTADLIPGDDWSDELGPDTSRLDPITRAALTDYWSHEARFEHASVASFARFLLQLLAVAAPAELLDGAQHAIHEEYEHARTALGFVAAYGGTPMRPGALPIHDALESATDPVAIAVSAAKEGCIAETVAAMQVAMAAECATDPAVKRALTRIAREEMEHAELAWTFLRWAVLALGPEVRSAVEQVFAEASRHVSLGAITDLPGDPTAMLAHGYLRLEDRKSVAVSVLSNVVAPAARALLAARGPSASGHGHGGHGHGALPQGKMVS